MKASKTFSREVLTIVSDVMSIIDHARFIKEKGGDLGLIKYSIKDSQLISDLSDFYGHDLEDNGVLGFSVTLKHFSYTNHGITISFIHDTKQHDQRKDHNRTANEDGGSYPNTI